jgi:integrase/recombinase XerD
MTPLRKRMLEDMQLRRMAERTQEAYIRAVAHLALYFKKSPDKLGPEEIRTYQLHLTNERGLAAPTIAVIVAALRFFYSVTLGRKWSLPEVLPQPKRPKVLPPILSPAEVERFLECVSEQAARIILTICYAAGLRISEAVKLTASDIDSQRMVIIVRRGKGSKDRETILSPVLLTMLRDWYRITRPTVWLFPGRDTGTHISPATVREACKDARLRCGIPKRIGPHGLRAAFAVHLHERGTDLRTIQLLLGHRSIATTALYLRLDGSKVCATQSPLDFLPKYASKPPNTTALH